MSDFKFRYRFHIDGKWFENVSYRDYCMNAFLREKVMNPDRCRLFLGLTIISHSQEWLDSHKGEREEFLRLKEDWRNNRLKYFAPNSIEQLKFINDWEHDVCAMVAPNRVGKTTVGVIKALLSGILETDKNWPIFKEHGITWKPFRGGDNPMKFAFCNYEWSGIKQVVWPRVREYVPDEQLGSFGNNWKDRQGMPRRREPNFERSQSITLTNGSVLKFHAYSQAQANYESDAYNGCLFDEQPPMCIFDAVDERLRTLRGMHLFTLTPHKVEGRPDTGGGTPLQRLLTGEEARGHNVVSYNTSIQEVPDWILPEAAKQEMMQKWIVEPTKTRNMRMLREGRSRVMGEWHRTSGIILDDWEKKFHIIDNFDVPADWTRYRALDHGITNPTCCLWIAVSPPDKDGYSSIVVYREYYSMGKTIYENVVEIVKLSGNERKRMSQVGDSRSGTMMNIWEESQTGEVYAKSVLDSRSFGGTDSNTGKTYGTIYKSSGLTVSPASGKLSQHWIPILKELIAPNYDFPHPFTAGVQARPRLMVMRSCVNLISEIEGWIWEEYRSGGDYKNQRETPRKLRDHGCTALGYACQIPLKWRGDLYAVQPSLRKSERTVTAYSDDGDDGEYRSI
jgi:phage terminase large subunit-like protein